MRLIDASYLYQTGIKLNELRSIRPQFFNASEHATTKLHALGTLQRVTEHLHALLFNSVFQLKIAETLGKNLLTAIEGVILICQDRETDEDKLLFHEYQNVSAVFSEFETVFKAELGRASIFLVTPKNAMDTTALVEAGYLAFPHDLGNVVPEAINDVNQAMSCIAFELPTAAAFHLHRVNEAVLKRYWSALTDEKIPHSMGNILEKMNKKELGEERIRSALRDLVRLHRNPTIHPEQSLETVEDAINLYGAVRSIVGFTVKEIVKAKAQEAIFN